MNKSLFSRFFLTCILIIVISIAVLGLVLIISFGSQHREDQFDLLMRHAQSAADVAAANYLDNDGAYIDVNTLSSGLKPLSRAVDADIFLVRQDGRVLFCTEGSNCRHMNYLVNRDIMDQASTVGYTERGAFGGMYSNTYMISGVPVDAGGLVIGVIFAAAPDGSSVSFSTGVMRGFVLATLLVLTVTFGVIYIMVDRLTRPIRAMAQATEAFARGDFTVRVPVEGYDEIEKLGLAFNNMSASLADLEASRRSMIANISHEFKTPITTIGGFVDGILDGTIPPEKYDYYLEVVSREVKRLSRLIVSMLNLARIEAGEMTFNRQPVDISELIRRTLFNFEMKIEEKQLVIEGLDIEKVVVEADPDMAHQVVYNIIENAVKFTPVGGYISVSHYTEGNMVYVSIRNSGEGIAKEEISRLFDRFYKSDTSRSIDKSGVGLGLHIVKSTLHIMGGDIMVKSVEGEYADFIFSLAVYRERTTGSLFRKGDSQKLDKIPLTHNPREEES